MVNNFGNTNAGQLRALCDPTTQVGGSDWGNIVFLPGQNGWTADGSSGATLSTRGTSAQSQVPMFTYSVASSKKYTFHNFMVPNDYSNKVQPYMLIYFDVNSTNTATHSIWEATTKKVTPSGTAVFDAAGTDVTSSITQGTCAGVAYYVLYAKIPVDTATYIGMKPGDLFTMNIDHAISGTGNLAAAPNALMTVFWYARA